MKLKKTKELHIYIILYIPGSIFHYFSGTFGTFFWPFFGFFASFLDLDPPFFPILGHFQIYWAIRMGILLAVLSGTFGGAFGNFWRCFRELLAVLSGDLNPAKVNFL
jgi:hypothetical protein